MKLSVMLFPYHPGLAQGKVTAAAIAADLKAGGATAVEAMVGFEKSYPEQWQALLAALADAGLGHACLDVGVNLVCTTDPEKQAAMDTVKYGLETAAALSCPVVLLAGSRPPEGMSNEEGRQRYAANLAAAAELAVPYGIVTTIEDFGVYPHFACGPEHCLEVLQGTGRDDVRFTYDNGNFLLANADPMDALALTRDRSVHVHIKDFMVDATDQAGLKSADGRAWRGCDIGAGAGRVPEVLASLKQSGYDGWVSLEVSVADALAGARQGMAYISEMWEQAG